MTLGAYEARECAVTAARSNMLWCDAVCRSHGRPGEVRDTIWFSRQATPPYYPNAITLTPEHHVAQVDVVRELQADLVPPWAVKDSFSTLDLASLGLQLLFDATWIWRPATLPPPATLTTTMWRRVTNAAELGAWELAWSGEPAGDPHARIFLPALLADPKIAIIAAYQDVRIVGGVIGHSTGDAVGMSNVFVPADSAEEMWAGCIAAVIAAFPHLPVVGYEHGNELTLAQMHGFEAVGPLRIWNYEGNGVRS